ncbi:conserved hypothetical protein [Verticillium alfalfae VaMs.102]|uniref:Pre-mRNA splicing factor n=1 Tax=Verticillium alfalfae (strain VaMs.102 / ATCC MYA-4576 / FGSC 10136) TaxID=526221 RepID=C9S653_VERA1|nr:conserved hypothetical protein [Verticillium alfalfae VaMs.102]EEY14392.1 conserved hypothetical protein [Verticillium alfalfae VaMs.102]
MTRVSVYSAALVAFVAATTMTIASITVPHWISYSATTVDGHTYSKHIGLHRTCSNLYDPPCREFPTADQCTGERSFCSMWRTVGFLASFATILQLATIVSFLVIMVGGRFKREVGWKLLGLMLIVVGLFEFSIMGVVAYLFDHDQQFTVPGWTLDTSWVLMTVSASVSLVCAVGLAVSAYVLPSEDGYDFLEDPIP